MELNVADEKVRHIIESVTIAKAKDLLKIIVAALRCVALALAVGEVCMHIAAFLTLHRASNPVLGCDRGTCRSNGTF